LLIDGFPLILKELVKDRRLIKTDYQHNGTYHRVHQQPRQLHVTTITSRKQSLFLVSGDHGLAGFTLFVEFIIGIFSMPMKVIQIKMPVVEIYTLFHELLDSYVAFDIGKTIGLKIPYIGYRNVEEPENNVEAFHINPHGIVDPDGNNNACQQSHQPQEKEGDVELDLLEIVVILKFRKDRKIIILEKQIIRRRNTFRIEVAHQISLNP